MTHLFQLVSNQSTNYTNQKWDLWWTVHCLCVKQSRVVCKLGYRRVFWSDVVGGCLYHTEMCLSVHIKHILQEWKARYAMSTALLGEGAAEGKSA